MTNTSRKMKDSVLDSPPNLLRPSSCT